MKIHEYQGKKILKSYDIPIQDGVVIDSKEDIEEMIMAVDDDGSGQIEFEEFLSIIQGSDQGDGGSKMNQFFKDMSNGEIGN